MAFIEAVVRATGRKQTIPQHWLDHPTLSEPFRLTVREERKAAPKRATKRRASKRAEPAEQPTEG